MSKFDYLTIGVVTKDLVEDGWTVGGTVSFAGRMAQALSCRTAVVTTAEADFDFARWLPELTVWNVPAFSTTTFSNIYTPTGRIQIIHAVAENINKSDIPSELLDTPIVHLGPLVREVDPAIIDLFPDQLVGVTPQGWMRRWREDGHVFAREWAKAEATLPKADAVILSEEDLLNDQMLTQYRTWSKLLVLTQGEKGCIVFWGDEMRQIPAPMVKANSLTGAGDIFAAAFLVQLHRNQGDAWGAAEFANNIASTAISAGNLDEKVMAVRNYMNEIGDWRLEIPQSPISNL